jgi:hypothetical protein
MSTVSVLSSKMCREPAPELSARKGKLAFAKAVSLAVSRSEILSAIPDHPRSLECLT